MFRKHVEDKLNEYIFGSADIHLIDKIYMLYNYLPDEIVQNITLYLAKKDINGTLFKAFKNCEPYEIMNQISKYDKDILKAYNDFIEDYISIENSYAGDNIYERPDFSSLFRLHNNIKKTIHPDLIPFLIDHNIVINDTIHRKFVDSKSCTSHCSFKLIKNCLEYKITDTANKICDALLAGKVELCHYLIKRNPNVIINDDEIDNLIYSATESPTIHSLWYIFSLRSDCVKPCHIIYAGYNNSIYHFWVLLNAYLDQGKDKFIISKEISDYILEGLCGIDGISLLKKNGFNIVDYDNIMVMKETNSLPKLTTSRTLEFRNFPFDSYSNKLKKCFNILEIPKQVTYI